MRLRLAALAVPLGLLLAKSVSGCAAGTPLASAASTATASETTAAPQAAQAASVSGPAPTKAECDAFMDVVARTTTLRASIHRESATAPKAADWAVKCAQIANQATALDLKNPDLLIENANLATRMMDLAAELRGLAQATMGDGGDKNASHKRVIELSEQVEVITREPAARCAGDTKQLVATSGHLPAESIQRPLRDRFPLAVKCYKEGLARNPKLEGRVLVRLVIGLDGKVTDARAVTGDAAKIADVITPSDTPAPPMSDAKVTACVVDVMRQTVFPAPDGGPVSVVYPVTLSRSQ